MCSHLCCGLSVNQVFQIFSSFLWIHWLCHLTFGRQQNVVHRDLKLGNLVLHRATHEIIITNFCLGQHLPSEKDRLRDQRGSPAYISPDVLSGKPYLGNIAHIILVVIWCLSLEHVKLTLKVMGHWVCVCVFREAIRHVGAGGGALHHALWPLPFLWRPAPGALQEDKGCPVHPAKVSSRNFRFHQKRKVKNLRQNLGYLELRIW